MCAPAKLSENCRTDRVGAIFALYYPKTYYTLRQFTTKLLLAANRYLQTWPPIMVTPKGYCSMYGRIYGSTLWYSACARTSLGYTISILVHSRISTGLLTAIIEIGQFFFFQREVRELRLTHKTRIVDEFLCFNHNDLDRSTNATEFGSICVKVCT